VVRREHRAERRRDGVELAVAERQRLGVGLDPLELHPLRGRLASSGLEVLRRQIRGHDLGARKRGADRDVPGSRRDVEHLLTGADPARLDKLAPEPPQGAPRELVIVAARPHGPLPGLELAILSR
jgi:hypothetical protein